MKKANVAIITLITVVLMLAWTAPIVADERGKININSAGLDELMLLEGVGEGYAQRIIEYRNQNGPFQQPEDLANVKGIGTKTLEKNKGRILVKDE